MVSTGWPTTQGQKLLDKRFPSDWPGNAESHGGVDNAAWMGVTIGCGMEKAEYLSIKAADLTSNILQMHHKRTQAQVWAKSEPPILNIPHAVTQLPTTVFTRI